MSQALVDVSPDRLEDLLRRHAGAGPRYTSYPTVPSWTDAYGPDDFAEDLAGVDVSEPLSLYVHVPFCRSLCHFCACNRVITRKPEAPERYLGAVVREAERVRAALPGAPRLAQHHWGGGTPTHLTPEQVHRLHGAVEALFPAQPGAERSIEVDPRVTTEAHVAALRECGFTRISLGVQDFDARVQEAIHRVQSVEQTAALVGCARAAGFESVAFDLIYGLPFQSLESFARTLDHVVDIAPDRIAIYGYAHVTWVAKQQRGFERHDLPDPRRRLEILVSAIRRLLEAGYVHVGLDHFARPGDALASALADGTLRRNFMGYTTRAGLELLGLGPSAISELAGAYAQSERSLPGWQDAAEAGRLATLRGHRLSRDDLERRFVISRLMCLGEVRAAEFEARFGVPFRERFAAEWERLASFEDDGLLERGAAGVRVMPIGRLVLRNIAMVFDAYLPVQQREARPLFSQTV